MKQSKRMKMSNELILNETNTQNGEMPKLDDTTKDTLETVRILQTSHFTCIPQYAFARFRSLQSVSIEDGATITSIGEWAFNGCTALSSINLPNDVTAIGGFAFSSCEALTSFTIPDGVTAINESAFQGCESLRCIVIPDGVTIIKRSAFCDCDKLETVIIPESVTTIENQAFYNCRALQLMEIPESVSDIGAYSIYRCRPLEKRQKDGINSHTDTTAWLRQRFKNLPIHRACYHASNSTKLSSSHTLSTLIQKDKQALVATDAMGMTPLHTLCCSPHTTVEWMRVVVEGEPSVLTQMDVTERTPLQQFLKCRNLNLSGTGQDIMPSLVNLLEKRINVEDLAILFVLNRNQEIDLTSQDEATSLMPFMMAAKSLGCGLDVVYALAMKNLDLDMFS